MDSIITIESFPISSGGYCNVNSGQTVTFSIISGITSGILVTYEWYLIRNLETTLVGISSGLTLTSLETDDQIYVKVINCNGSSGISGTSGTSGSSGTSNNGTSGTSGTSGSSGTSSDGTNGTSGTSGTSGLINLTGTTDNQIIIWSGNTWEISNKLVIPGSFTFDPSRGVMVYETIEDGHYEIAIFGDSYGLSGVTNGDHLVYNNGYWINSAITCNYENIYFYYNDIISGTSQKYYIDLLSSFDYKIVSIILQSDKPINVDVKIDNMPILWSGNTTTINISSGITETISNNYNYVPIGKSVTLNTVDNDNDTKIIQGKIKYLRSTCVTTTTTTTLEPTTTTTTTLPPTTTTTTTLYVTTTYMPTTTIEPTTFELFGQFFKI
jgi:hypothetical protein